MFSLMATHIYMKYELKFIKLIMFKSKFYYFLHIAKGYSFRYSCAIALIAFLGGLR
jgi:hypothetical protein